MKYDWIVELISLLPIIGLIWKAAKQSSKIEELEKNYNGIVRRVDRLETESEENIKNILVQLAYIQQSIARIETKLEERTGR